MKDIDDQLKKSQNTIKKLRSSGIIGDNKNTK